MALSDRLRQITSEWRHREGRLLLWKSTTAQHLGEVGAVLGVKNAGFAADPPDVSEARISYNRQDRCKVRSEPSRRDVGAPSMLTCS